MIKSKKLLREYIPLLTLAVAGFALSVFNLQNSFFIGAWIAPLAMMRFTRKVKWSCAIFIGFAALSMSVFLGSMSFSDTVQSNSNMSLLEAFIMMTKTGYIFLAPNALLPFLLDKAFYKRLPALAGSLIYPLCVLVIDLFMTLWTGGMVTIGETQVQVQAIMGTASLVGASGVGFIISWFAPVMNFLWEQKGKWRLTGSLKWVYPVTMGVLVLYGSIYVAFPQKSKDIVKIAGITSNIKLMDSIMNSGVSLYELKDFSPDDIYEILGSTEEYIQILIRKTEDAITAGAKVIIWQEFSFHATNERVIQVIEEMKSLARKKGVYIVMSYGEILSSEEKEEWPLRNISTLIQPDGTLGWEYAKTKVNPGYEDVIYQGGDGVIPYVDTPFGRMGLIICADGLYQHFVRQAYINDIDILLIPSWDSFSSTPKITDCTDIRAVEYGFTSIRIAGNGLSTASDPYYRRWGMQNSFEPNPEKSYTDNFYVNVPVFSRKTFFGSIGYWLQWFSIFALPGLIIWSMLRKKEKI